MAERRRWTENETRRVLELYGRLPFGKFHSRNPDVIALSAEIDRTPDSVAMKLSNFASLDPAIIASGRSGLPGATELDRQIWEEFHSADAQADETALPSGRVWITSFWGFNPEQDGYLGFTREGDRTTFLREWRPGDLVMVYATMGDQALPDERGRVLGFLEVERRTIHDTDRMSSDGVRWKTTHGMSSRWTYAVPVVRAWRTVENPLAREIAPITLGPGANFRLISGRGVFLTEKEAATALSLLVRPVQAYGGTELPAGETVKVYTPSKGFPMGFGKRSFETKDGAHFLYALKLDCDVQAVINEPAHRLHGKAVVKIGLAKDPDQRCAQHNACLPPGGKLKWKLFLRSKSLPDGASALAAEDDLKARFSDKFRSLGGEFFLCDEKILAGEFARAEAGRR